jgi:hypothetical protein
VKSWPTGNEENRKIGDKKRCALCSSSMPGEFLRRATVTLGGI